MTAIDYQRYPPNLTALDISVLTPQVDLSSLPRTLLKLRFGAFTHGTIRPDDLPPTLESLSLGNHYNYPLIVGVLPLFLKFLDLGSSFNKPLIHGLLPLSLTILVDERLVPNFLPASLTFLDLSHIFDFPLPSSVIPTSLRHLVLGKAYNHELDPDIDERFTNVLEYLYNLHNSPDAPTRGSDHFAYFQGIVARLGGQDKLTNKINIEQFLDAEAWTIIERILNDPSINETKSSIGEQLFKTMDQWGEFSVEFNAKLNHYLSKDPEYNSHMSIWSATQSIRPCHINKNKRKAIDDDQ
eukprot:gene18940-22666_t